MRIKLSSVSFFGVAALVAMVAPPVHADQIGTISACYACQNTGDAAVDAALTANPDVATDAILFDFTKIPAPLRSQEPFFR